MNDKTHEKCKWLYEPCDESYMTTCGESQYFIEGDIEDNHYKFCPYCGKEIRDEFKEECAKCDAKYEVVLS